MEASLQHSFQGDQNGSHVIASQPRGGVLGDQLVQQSFHHCLDILAPIEFLTHQVDHALVVLYIFLPNAIAAHDYVLVVRAPNLHLYVGLARYHLLRVI